MMQTHKEFVQRSKYPSNKLNIKIEIEVLIIHPRNPFNHNQFGKCISTNKIDVIKLALVKSILSNNQKIKQCLQQL